MEVKKIAAIDFELMTAEHTSVCAVGIACIDNGVMTHKFHSLVKPIPDDRDSNNAWLHGITPEMVENAPTFQEIYPIIKHLIDGRTLVCHKASTEVYALAKIREVLNIPPLDFTGFIDTFEATSTSLEKACVMAGIPVGEHHDALADAIACAKLCMKIHNVEVKEAKPAPVNTKKPHPERNIDSKYKEKPDLDKVENKDNAFYGSSLVITGIFKAYPNRNELAKKLQSLGADVNTTISGKTTIVVIGEGAGPSKLEKIEKLRSQGKNIRTIYEDELVELLKDL